LKQTGNQPGQPSSGKDAADLNRSSPMKHTRRSLILLTTFAVAAALNAATEENLSKAFTVSPGGKLVVDVDFGAIEVVTNSASEVSVEVYRKVGMKSEDKEKAFLAERPVTFQQDGDTVTVRSRKPGKVGWSWNWGSQKLEGRYTLRVPVKFNVKLATSGGHIHVSDLTGEVKAATSGGGLKFARIHGPIDGDTSGGGIQLADCEGVLKVDTSGGGIESVGGSGTLHADTSGGSIRVKNFAGPAHLDTSGGGIKVENVGGAVAASTSGGSITASLPAPLPGAVKLGTSGGGITVNVPESAAFDLDADTSAGSVSCDLPITIEGKKHRDHLKGAVNGGGPKVSLDTSAGSIHIRKLVADATR
jgi:hypothetical protein